MLERGLDYCEKEDRVSAGRGLKYCEKEDRVSVGKRTELV